jgi:hypothetical protein
LTTWKHAEEGDDELWIPKPVEECDELYKCDRNATFINVMENGQHLSCHISIQRTFKFLINYEIGNVLCGPVFSGLRTKTLRYVKIKSKRTDSANM